MKRLAILGASGHGKVLADIAELCGWDEIVFFDDAWPSLTQNGVWSLVGDSQILVQQLSDFSGVIVAIGNNAIRAEKLRYLAEKQAPIVSLIHPSAIISSYANIDAGCAVMAGVVVNADTEIATGVILNTACSVDHDCVIGANAHISPGARLAGGVQIGARSWIGIGASVKQLIRVGSDVRVGGGAAVVADLPDGVTAVGVPARCV